MRSAFAFGLAIITLGVACGGQISTDLGSGDPDAAAPDDAGDDADPTDGAFDARHDGATSDAGSDGAASDSASGGDSCFGPCVPGESTCLSSGVASCTKDASGCNVWGAPVACGTNQLCEHTLRRASCTCEPGTVMSGGACVAVIGAPRPIAPLSTATVTSRTPTLHWKLAPATDGAQVDICQDRACTSIETTFVATGSSGAPAAALSAGVHFWRLHGTQTGSVGGQTSPVWELTAGARSAPVDTSFGTSPDVDGDGFSDVVVGTVNTGRTADFYVYAGGPSGTSTSPTITHGPTTGFGTWGLATVDVASAGDMNGDGYSDVAVSTYSNQVYTVGSIWVYLGGPSGLVSPGINLALQGTSQYSNRGPPTVSPAGDVNGDGYADIIATAAFRTNAVYVFLGSAAGPSSVPIVINEPLDYSPQVGSVGDVNADGYGDVIALGVSNTGSMATYLHLGGPSGPSTTPIVFPALGGLTSAGDVNGDGLCDAIAGTALYYGDASLGLVPSNVVLTAPPSAMNDSFGSAYSPAGDVNGDGFADVVIGARGRSSPSGDAYIFLGGAGGPSMTPVQISGTGYFGSACAAAGDVNRDGFSDVLVGVPGPGGTSPAGTVEVFLGATSGPSLPPIVLSGSPYSSFAFLGVLRATGRTRS